MSRGIGNTGFKGIHKHSLHNNYEARVRFNNTTYYIGSYNTLQQAVKARVDYITSLI